jgi:hypothetical protein
MRTTGIRHQHGVEYHAELARVREDVADDLL